MKAALFVCALAATAIAAPRDKRTTKLDAKLGETVRAAEQAWTTAEHETDPAKQPALWERAAVAFGEVDSAPVDVKVKRDAAYAAVLAWKNALATDPRIATEPRTHVGDAPATPRPVPAREQKLIAAIDRYIKYGEPNDPQLPGLMFLKARALARFDQMEAAIPIAHTIVERYGQHEVVEYAANLILDSYNRLRQYDQLVAFADELANNATLMATFTELAQVVARIQRQAQRKRVEQLEVAARAAQELEKYTAVGTAYLELYNASPRAPDGDELLYNAGVAFETSRSIAAAIQAFALLQRQYPKSKLAPRALARLGRIYSDIAMYDKAAEMLEEYARKYAGEQDAADAMSDAVYYRKAIGDRDKAIADTEYFIKTFGAKRPREAADASWSLTALYEAEPERAVAHLQRYLRSFGNKGGAARVVIAHAKIGQLLWKQSCPLEGVDGLCVRANERAARTCGTEPIRTLAPSTRDARKRAEALAAFTRALKEYERQGASIDDPAAHYYFAQAKLAAADAELEEYLALAFPRGLSFDPAAPAVRTTSMKRFSEWLEQKKAAGAALMRQYEAVLATKDAATSITATGRIGVISEGFATELVTGEIPRDVRTAPHAGDNIKAYCRAMTDVAEPLEENAALAFATCLAKSTELAWFGESSAQCEQQLARMKSAEFPRANERRSQPLLVAPVIAAEPPPP